MTIDVSLLSRGHIPQEDLRSFIEEFSGRAATAEKGYEDETMSAFRLDFRNPFNRRQDRSMRCHHSQNVEPRYAEHVGYGDYTYLTMGAHDRSEDIMRAVAAKWGGYLTNEETGLFEWLDAAPAENAPAP